MAASAEGLKIEWAIASELSSHPEKWASQGRDEASSAVPGGKATAVLTPGAEQPEGISEDYNLEGTESACAQPRRNERPWKQKDPKLRENVGYLTTVSSRAFL